VSRRGIPFVVSAPSGTGKTTVCGAVVARDPGIVLSTSHTTRPMRPGEREGVDYHFVSPAVFRHMVSEGAFLEWAEYSGNLYGTSHAALEARLEGGIDVLLEIETEGARQVRARRPDAHLIFLLPPSLAALEARLRGRGTDDPADVERRLQIARREFGAAGCFRYFVVNDEVEVAVSSVCEVIEAVRAGDADRARARFGRDAMLGRLDPELAAQLGR
jgi:guanylate kinase